MYFWSNFNFYMNYRFFLLKNVTTQESTKHMQLATKESRDLSRSAYVSQCEIRINKLEIFVGKILQKHECVMFNNL